MTWNQAFDCARASLGFDEEQANDYADAQLDARFGTPYREEARDGE